ncbi:RNA polymerase I associated factor, A49-like protein [Marasmius fiardii PR-910]|nr:RNA polymerase I associated factor, A49-like protein [Marasmius fiardii PR-910]
MSSSTVSKKRKRADSTARENPGFRVAEPSKAGTLGPVLVSFPALKAPESTAFKCFSEGGKVNSQEIIVGETPEVEFVSNDGESRHVAASGCHYLLAVHDPRTSSLRIIPTPKTPHVLGRTVKKLKSIPIGAIPSNLAYREARTTLGETFGTKKAKAAIRAEQRNRVDVAAMQGVMQHVIDGIEKGAEGLLTAEEVKEIEDTNRPIPQFDDTTTDPAEVYPLHNIIPESEWRAIDTSQFDAAKSPKDRIALLPSARPDWVQTHVRALEGSNQKSAKKKWKMVYYVSALFALFRILAPNNRRMDKQTIRQKLKGVPTLIVDGMLSRFSETSRDSDSHSLTSGMETKLLSFLLALCLHADDYMSNPDVIAGDLSLTTQRVQELFKNLGCKIKKPTDRELSNAGLGQAMKNVKMAVLTAPVEFPKLKIARKKQRG